MTTITQVLTAFPTAPDRINDTPSEFSDHVDAYLDAVVAHVTESNTWATQCNTVAGEVNANAAAAAVSETNAAASEDVAQSSANYIGEWSDQVGAATVPTCVSHSNRYWQLTEDLADITAKEPGVDSEWMLIPYKNHVESAKTANYNITASDLYQGSVFTNTGADGAVTLTLPAGASGYHFGMYVAVAQYLRATAAAGEKFRYSAVQSAAAGYIRENTIGRYIFCKWTGDNWLITEINGTWKMDE
jgi:hypothetical protein